ncbi:MAG: hypothetical protein MJ252_07790 [archaeon]|nr:hypothetical protein [archaeon]
MSHKQKKQEELEEIPVVDLSFCFQLEVILNEQLSKLEYIGKYTASNSKGAMSKIIGAQIQEKLKTQSQLEEKFEELIQKKAEKVELVDEDEINEMNKQINQKAMDLKLSAYSIYKTLAENPDVPKNLVKAKNDQRILIGDIVNMKSDLVNGNFDNYEKIIKRIEGSRFDIEQLRKREMSLFKDLKNLNAEYANEEKEFKSDRNEMEAALFSNKKKFANTKLEEDLYDKYTRANIEALVNLYESNFAAEEDKIKKEINNIVEEQKKNSNLNDFFKDHLGKQKKEFETLTKQWNQTLAEKEKEKDAVNENLRLGNQKKHEEIQDLKNKISVYRVANDGLEKDAVELKTVPYDLIHNPKAREAKAKADKERAEAERNATNEAADKLVEEAGKAEEEKKQAEAS